MKYADTILYGATFFAGKNQERDYNFLAMADGKIIARGKGDLWKEYAGENTKLIRLTKDQLVLPGFHDSHLHLIMAALNITYIDLGDAKSEEEAARLVGEFAKTIPDDEWVIGLNWYHMNWEKRELPTVRTIDKYVPDRPVFLTNTEVHGAWVNSKALQITGINRDTPNPEHGEIVKFKDGEPTGYLNELAMGIAGRVAMKFNLDREKQLVQSILKVYSSYGITAVQDMRPELGYVLGQYETFYELAQEDKLQVRVHSAASLLDNIDDILAAQKKFSGDKYQICLAKQYLDGVPTTHTAMVVEPYLDAPGEYGAPINDIEVMQEQVYQAHQNGLSVKIHCCGDGAVRQALTLYENAIKRFGDTGARHSVEHVEIIQPEDVERFKRFNIIASMQPEHMVIQVDRYSDNPYFDKYSEKQMKTAWIFRTLLDKGITVAFGTDCPVVEINPMMGIYRAVTRLFNDGEPKGSMQPEQKISVEEALHCYTYNSAYGVRREHELGTLEVGKYADIAILDRNILATAPGEIKDTKVIMTFMDGKLVYDRAQEAL